MSSQLFMFSALGGAMAGSNFCVALLSRQWIYGHKLGNKPGEEETAGVMIDASLTSLCIYSDPDDSNHKPASWLGNKLTVWSNFTEGGHGGSFRKLFKQWCNAYEEFPPHLAPYFFKETRYLQMTRFCLLLAIVFASVGVVACVTVAGKKYTGKAIRFIPLAFLASSAAGIIASWASSEFWRPLYENSEAMTGTPCQRHFAWWLSTLSSSFELLGFLLVLFAVVRATKERQGAKSLQDSSEREQQKGRGSSNAKPAGGEGGVDPNAAFEIEWKLA
uniref:Uncharacterized protein n=1 Tax=Chromera velia CCMP2878 TaxID=1169474 RepID=A0A0G4G7N5_9ALVE|eukprot:Cvel_4286.t1-p1 / transcript=Cvel_4286.t1 / gene=Cvel_4286 / organism=Chromera_velia_CCMP2878 / gene_product=hypothetical protein / transcript_product=hypothetical protein / location=Cvel_scaffold186:7450-11289(-) / protein_length=274 / sequence_SO=supercontig / SO=protein_coding / is_pseudo=false